MPIAALEESSEALSATVALLARGRPVFRRDDRATVRRTIIEILADVTSTPVADIDDESTLLGNLRIDGDDFSMRLVPRIHWVFGIATQQSDWRGVVRVADLVELVWLRLRGEP